MEREPAGITGGLPEVIDSHVQRSVRKGILTRLRGIRGGLGAALITGVCCFNSSCAVKEELPPAQANTAKLRTPRAPSWEKLGDLEESGALEKVILNDPFIRERRLDVKLKELDGSHLRLSVPDIDLAILLQESRFEDKSPEDISPKLRKDFEACKRLETSLNNDPYKHWWICWSLPSLVSEKTDDPLSLIQASIEMAQRIKFDNEKAEALADIAGRLAETGDRKGAAVYFQKAILQAESAAPFVEGLLCDIATAQTANGFATEARETAERIMGVPGMFRDDWHRDALERIKKIESGQNVTENPINNVGAYGHDLRGRVGENEEIGLLNLVNGLPGVTRPINPDPVYFDRAMELAQQAAADVGSADPSDTLARVREACEAIPVGGHGVYGGFSYGEEIFLQRISNRLCWVATALADKGDNDTAALVLDEAFAVLQHQSYWPTRTSSLCLFALTDAKIEGNEMAGTAVNEAVKAAWRLNHDYEANDCIFDIPPGLPLVARGFSKLGSHDIA